MRNRLKNLNPIWKSYTVAGSVCVILYCFLMNIGKITTWMSGFFQVFAPIFVGIIIAFVLNPLAMSIMNRIFKNAKKNQLAWTFSVIITVIVLFAFIALLVILIGPQLVDNVKHLLANIDAYANNMKIIARPLGEPYNEIVNNAIDALVGKGGLIHDVGSSFLEDIQPLLDKTVDYGTKAVRFIISFILALYFLLAKRSISRTFSTFFNLILSPSRYYRTSMLFQKLDDIFSKYIFFQLIDSLLIGICNYLFMILTGMPDAIIISVLNAVTNLIPTFGPIIGGATGGILLLMTKPEAVIPYLVFTIVLQMSDGYIIKPKLFGDALNVPGVIILASVIVLGDQMGAGGALLAIPFAAIIVFIYKELLLPWLQLRKDIKAYSKETENSVNESGKHASE